jgi:hypothetical protein
LNRTFITLSSTLFHTALFIILVTDFLSDFFKESNKVRGFNTHKGTGKLEVDEVVFAYYFF